MSASPADAGGGSSLVPPTGLPGGSFRSTGTRPRRAGGDPEELARLELAQEAGLRASGLARLGFLHSAQGLSGQGCHVFLATGLTQGTPEREPEEQDMRHAWVSRAEFTGMINGGAITDDATIAAYALLLLHEQGAGGAASA